jgi:hypothetical protein
MSYPPAIIFINADINDGIKTTLQSQLYINEIMSDTEFDARVAVDPNYPNLIHLNRMRILVIRQNFRDYTNRNLADVVMFVKQGMAAIEKNNFGPPGLTLDIQRVNIYTLLRYNNSGAVVILPHATKPPHACGCKCHCDCDRSFGCNCCLGGIVVDQLADSSGVHCANPDNEYNNPDFINRK